MVKDYELLKDNKLLFARKLIIWGFGVNGKKIVDDLYSLADVVCIVDADSGKWGEYKGISICAPDKIVAYKENHEVAVVITTENAELQNEIINNIKEYECQDIDIYTSFAVKCAMIWNAREDLGAVQEKSDELSELRRQIEQQDARISFLEARFAQMRELMQAEASQRAVYVYQSKKVASCSIMEGVAACGKQGVHVHDFSSMGASKPYAKNLIKQSSGKVISLVRDPIARQMSLMWHYWGHNTEKFLQRYDSVASIEKAFWRIPNGEDEFQWFLGEFQDILDVNIYDYPFDREKGYGIIEKDDVSILLLKLEKLDALEDVIADFLGVRDFKPINSNMAEDKSYQFAYKQYKKECEIPREFVDYYYKENKFMDYFYTEEEKRQFYKHWEKNIV